MALRSVDDVFIDFCGRRRGILRALTTDVADFYAQCGPEKENLCLYGYADGGWEVALPCDEVYSWRELHCIVSLPPLSQCLIFTTPPFGLLPTGTTRAARTRSGHQLCPRRHEARRLAVPGSGPLGRVAHGHRLLQWRSTGL